MEYGVEKNNIFSFHFRDERNVGKKKGGKKEGGGMLREKNS